MAKYFSIIGMSVFFIFALLPLSFSEQLTITTYYPSPVGVYNDLQAYKLAVGDTDGDGQLTSADLPADINDFLVAGKVGIGTTTPGNTLDVNGGIRVINLIGASATPLCIDGATGDLSVCSSSKKFKENIVYLKPKDEQKILEDIRQTRIAKFKMKTENRNVAHFGLIAEESPKALQFIDAHSNTNIDLLSAQLGYTWAAIKALDKKIEQLEKENQRLKARIEN